MKVTVVSSCKQFENTANHFLEGAEGIIRYTNESVCVWTGALHTIDRKVCEELGLEIGTGIYLGGTIVNMPGDLSICISTYGRSEIPEQIIERVKAYFAERGLSISADQNDVLIDGKKIASYACAGALNGWWQGVVHFSVGPVDLELIEKICRKPMEKIPGSLLEHGISASDILEAINLESF